MKVLSLTQPWASLVALGAKKIETRSWDTRYRGPLAIHASKSFPEQCRELCFDAKDISYGLFHFAQYYGVNSFPLGKIIAVCHLIDCVYITDQPGKTLAVVTEHLTANPHSGHWARFMRHGGEYDISREFRFGDYTPGRYMWLLSNVQALDKPIPAKGRLGLWEFEMRDPRGGDASCDLAAANTR